MSNGLKAIRVNGSVVSVPQGSSAYLIVDVKNVLGTTSKKVIPLSVESIRAEGKGMKKFGDQIKSIFGSDQKKMQEVMS